MLATRGAMAVLATGLIACTAPNPEYFDPAGSCSVGQRGCVGTRPVICSAQGALETVACPTGAGCVGGNCVQPAEASPCFSDRDCSGGRVCTAVVDGTRLGVISTFCVAPEGITDGAQACRGPHECRSALCLPSGGLSICYRACQLDSDCSSGTRCNSFDVEISGVRGTIRGCRPV